ncbi:LysE family translocator [Magnetovibrio sp.]|uniref:LysE family translocator n=1 Tax=Magnetovibrio sp. TaxID=2024836 RepID=UPI002F942071
MSLELWSSFVAVTLVTVLSPGPAVLLAVTHSARFGVRRAVVPILGNITGLAILVSLTAFGLGTVMEASSQAFTVLRLAGGAYLIYLGIKLLRAKALDLSNADGLIVQPSRRKSYLQGIAVALSNPKAIVFIGALFPQFIDLAHPIWSQLAIMGLTLMAMSFGGLMVWATLSSALVVKGRKSLCGKINKVSGTLFIAFGAALAAGSR